MTTKLVQADIDYLGRRWTLEELRDVVAGVVSSDDAFTQANKISKLFDGATNGEVLAGCVITIMRILARAKDLEKELKESPGGEAPN